MRLIERPADGLFERRNPWKPALQTCVAVVFELDIINGDAVFFSFRFDCKPGGVGLRTVPTRISTGLFKTLATCHPLSYYTASAGESAKSVRCIGAM